MGVRHEEGATFGEVFTLLWASTPSRGTRNTFQFTNEVVLGCAPLFHTSTLAVCTTGSRSRSREHTRLSLIAALPLGLTAFARKFHFLDFRAAGHSESLLQLMCVCYCTGAEYCASCYLCWTEGRRQKSRLASSILVSSPTRYFLTIVIDHCKNYL